MLTSFSYQKLSVIQFWDVKFRDYKYLKDALRKTYPYLELFWSIFSRIRTEYGEILRFSRYSVRIRENTDKNNSKYGHFSLNDGIW